MQWLYRYLEALLSVCHRIFEILDSLMTSLWCNTYDITMTQCIHTLTLLLQVALTPENIETILNTLVYDGKAESSVVMGGGGGREVAATTVFRLSRPLVSDTGLSRIPCGVCPVSITSSLRHTQFHSYWQCGKWHILSHLPADNLLCTTELCTHIM